jgi:hypothetical protein
MQEDSERARRAHEFLTQLEKTHQAGSAVR